MLERSEPLRQTEMDLVGFLNPSCSYPGVVIAVWQDKQGQCFGGFSQGKNATCLEVIPLEKNAVFVPLPDGWRDTSIAGLSANSVCLFALESENIAAYSFSCEKEFLSTLLEDPGFSIDQPFLRLSIAKSAGAVQLIMVELLAAASHLMALEVLESKGGARKRVENWLTQQKRGIAEQFESVPEFREAIANLPSRIEDLAHSSWWRAHMVTNTSGKLLSLDQIENRNPSPKCVTIINRQPIVPDERMLAIMARHLLNGTDYMFFHSPEANESVLDHLRTATDEARSSAKSSAIGPQSKLRTTSVGSIDFYSLQSEWTGSPYVMYLDAAVPRFHVDGYRGIDVGAAIARSYVKLKDNFAYELLEALFSKPPQPIRDWVAPEVSREDLGSKPETIGSQPKLGSIQ